MLIVFFIRLGNSSKRKNQEVLEKIANSLNNPPQLHIPPIQWIPPPPPPPPSPAARQETDIDEIKSFAILIEKKKRNMTPDRANSTMLKIHQLIYDEQQNELF